MDLDYILEEMDKFTGCTKCEFLNHITEKFFETEIEPFQKSRVSHYNNKLDLYDEDVDFLPTIKKETSEFVTDYIKRLNDELLDRKVSKEKTLFLWLYTAMLEDCFMGDW